MNNADPEACARELGAEIREHVPGAEVDVVNDGFGLDLYVRTPMSFASARELLESLHCTVPDQPAASWLYGLAIRWHCTATVHVQIQPTEENQ